MQYKTIVLELIQQRMELHEQLRVTRQLLPTVETCARRLKSSHEEWKATLAESRPDSNPLQTSSEAMELALQDLEELLSDVSQSVEEDPLSLGAAIAHIHATSPKK